jgi:hypothetical protein
MFQSRRRNDFDCIQYLSTTWLLFSDIFLRLLSILLKKKRKEKKRKEENASNQNMLVVVVFARRAMSLTLSQEEQSFTGLMILV